MRIVRTVLVQLFLVTSAFAGEFTGPITDVLDGDTIKVALNHRKVTVRLNGIDAPEKGQPYGHKAGEYVAIYAFGQAVTVRTFGIDKYGRSIGDVYLSDGTLLNKELVKAGLAWWYCKYSIDESLAKLELEAREAKVGLWQDQKPVPPWVYRKRQRGQSVSSHDMACLRPTTVPIPNDGTRPPFLPPSDELATLPVVGNVLSRKYHLPHCSGYSQINFENRVQFRSEAEAAEAGYHRAGNCP